MYTHHNIFERFSMKINSLLLVGETRYKTNRALDFFYYELIKSTPNEPYKIFIKRSY